MLITVTKKSAYTIKDELLNAVNGLSYEVDDETLKDLKDTVRRYSLAKAKEVSLGILNSLAASNLRGASRRKEYVDTIVEAILG